MPEPKLSDAEITIRGYEEVLRKERRSGDFFASLGDFEVETPMLIEGLMPERGVSVFYGAFDEFKTTLILDMMAHVAVGEPWQGRKVQPCPVILYALEGMEEIPVKLTALENNLKERGTPWGNDRLPIFVRDRIPESPLEWRSEIKKINLRCGDYMWARWQVRDLASDSGNLERPWYPTYKADAPIIVIDTLSLALGGEDEKGPRVVGFINECLDLIKWLPDINNPHDRNTDPDKFDKWNEDNPDLEYFTSPAASHIIIIHHQTKTGNDFAGHRAVGANTQNIYRVHRSGKISDASRPFAGQLTPVRTKDIMRPAPISFEVDVVSVEGTKRTAAILKDKAKAIPKKLEPIIKALRKLDDHEEIRREDLNACLDEVSKSTGSAQRAARKRNRESLEAAGVLVPVEDDSGKVAFYRFHDTGAT